MPKLYTAILHLFHSGTFSLRDFPAGLGWRPATSPYRALAEKLELGNDDDAARKCYSWISKNRGILEEEMNKSSLIKREAKSAADGNGIEENKLVAHIPYAKWKLIHPQPKSIKRGAYERMRWILRNGWTEVLADCIPCECRLSFKHHHITPSGGPQVRITAGCGHRGCPRRFYISFNMPAPDMDVVMEVLMRGTANHNHNIPRALSGARRTMVANLMQDIKASDYPKIAMQKALPIYSWEVLRKVKSDFKKKQPCASSNLSLQG